MSKTKKTTILELDSGQGLEAGDRWYKEKVVTGCNIRQESGLITGCPFYEPSLRRQSFCGWYGRETKGRLDGRPDFCEVVLVRVEGIKR